eukprot:366454-Chlamydomonas_euryale.AAC.14
MGVPSSGACEQVAAGCRLDAVLRLSQRESFCCRLPLSEALGPSLGQSRALGERPKSDLGASCAHSWTAVRAFSGHHRGLTAQFNSSLRLP